MSFRLDVIGTSLPRRTADHPSATQATGANKSQPKAGHFAWKYSARKMTGKMLTKSAAQAMAGIKSGA